MAARDKKTPAGSGGLNNKKATNITSPVPLRESTSNVQTAIAPGTISSPTQTHTTDIVNETIDGPNNQSDVNVTESSKKVENSTLKRGNKKEDDVNNTPETPANTLSVKRTTPKRGKKVVAKRNANIKNKLKTDLKAKNKTITAKRKTAKKIASVAELELASNPEKKSTLIKNGIRNNKLKKTVNENKTMEIDNPEIGTVPKGRKRKISPKKSSTQETSSDTTQTKKDDIEDDIEGEKKPETNNETSTDTPKKLRRVLKRNILGPTKRMMNKKLSAEKQKIVDAIAKVTKFDAEAQNVINQLDLNVTAASLKKTVQINKKRRHSIEKMAHFTDDEHFTTLPRGFINFIAIPRSGSPKTKKGSTTIKPGRQSSDILMSHVRTRSPYSTRSDSPARILRNGKHRKLKDSQLLDGIESEYRKRRRILSDSREGSEISKNSGYLSESESSYCESTVSAIENGTPDIQLDIESLKNVDESKLEPVKKDVIDQVNSTQSSLLLESSKESEISSTMDKLKEEEQIDNENNNKNKSIKLDVSKEIIEDKSKVPQILEEFEQFNSKVPEKIIILNKMAQNFNDVPVDSETTWSGKRTRATTKKAVKQVSEETPVKPIAEDTIKSSPEEISEVGKLQAKLDENISTKKLYEDCVDSEMLGKNDKTVVVSSTPEKSNMADNESNILLSDNTILDGSDIVNNLECNNSSELGNNSTISLKLEESTTTETEDNITQPIQNTTIDPKSPDNSLYVSKVNPDIPKEESIPDNIKIVTPVLSDVSATDTTKLQTKETKENSTESVIVNDDSVLKALDINTVDVTLLKQPTPITSEPSQDENKDVATLENVINASSNMIIETPENQKIKEIIMKALGLQSSKEAAETKVARTKRPITRTDYPYTGTLKTVIKLNRTSPDKKKGRGHLKMTLQKSKSKNGSYTNGESMEGVESSPDAESNTYYKVMKEVNTGWNSGAQSSDTAGANRKSHYSSNRSNIVDGSSEQMSDEGGGTTTGVDGEDGAAGNSGKEKTLVIPEKASSFSIHPHRLCRDECCYCFGRFGLFDTPCHIAQMKSSERQRKILEIEKHLTPDSCLCDACYRHVDRKANVPSYSKQYKRSVSTGPTHSGPRNCHAVGCQQDATHSVRRKWILKMKRHLHQYVQFDLDSTQGLHSIPVCETHFETLERLMTCAMCKRRLARNQAHNIGFPEAEQLNEAFEKRKLPIRLTIANAGTSAEASTEKSSGGSAVCKLCRYFATLLLKPPDNARPPHTLLFFESYEKRLMQFSDAEMMDENEIEEPIVAPIKEKEKEKPSVKKSKKGKIPKTLHNKQISTSNNNTTNSVEQTQSEITDFIPPKLSPTEVPPEVVEQIKTDISSPPAPPPNDSELVSNDNSVTKDPRVPSTNDLPDIDVSLKSRSNSPLNNVLTNSVEPSDAEVVNDSGIRSNKTEVPHKPVLVRRLAKDSKHIVELHKIQKDKKSSDSSSSTSLRVATQNHKVVERLETNPSISVRQLFPGEDDLPLQGSVEFGNVKERTPEGWEKCNMIVQYDHDTKRLWNELQKPYGNHSSFLRHLILLEKYFRNGDLVLTPSASHHATNYCESVQNRLRAYDNIPSNSSNIQPIAMLPFNTPNTTIRKQTISQSGIITGTSGKSLAPKTSTPITLPNMPPNFISPVNIVRQRSPSVPPGLIQLQSSGPRPQSTLIRLPTGNKKPFPQSSHPNRIQRPMRPTLIPLTQNKIAATITSGALTKQGDGKRAPSVVQVMSGGKSFQLSIQDYSRMCLMKQREGLDLRPIGTKKVGGNGPGGAQTVSLSTVSVLRQRSPVTSIAPITNTPREPTPIDVSNKNILEQFKQSTNTSAEQISTQNNNEQLTEKKPVMILPKIPKSLTVIPQTVRKSSESQSPPNLSVVSLNKPS